jgi:hypothetical protein
MARLETSFWGDPKYTPRDKDVARFVEVIRELTEKQSDTRALKTATSALSAIIVFIVERFGLKEALALLDRLRNEVTGV